jgi:hypothetical protein
MASANELSPLSDGSNVIRFSVAGSPEAIDLLSEAAEQLGLAQRESGLRLEEQIGRVEEIEQRGAVLLGQLTTRFLDAGGHAEALQQIRIWEAVSLYLARLASAYVQLLRLFQTYGKGWAAAGDRLPVVIARALRTNGLRMKWMRLHYQPIAPGIWQTFSQLSAYIEDKGLMRSRVFVYDDLSTLQRELTKPLMFAMSAADSLPLEEIDVADRLISHLAGRFRFQRHPGRGCGFVLDVDRWTMPSRHRPGDGIRLGTRFFGPGDAIADLEMISAQLAAGDISTADVNLDGVTDVEMAIGVMAHLERHWSVERPERRSRRDDSSSSVAVTAGFAEIVRRVAGRDQDAAADEETMEVWGLDNESDAGIGALVPAEGRERPGVGGLVGMRSADSRSWAVGVIRRLAVHDAARRRVGIELLGRGVQAVELYDLGHGGRVATGLLLPSLAGESAGREEVSVLLPGSTFSAEVAFEMRAFGKRYVLQPLMVVEAGKDFELGRFHINDRVG